MLHAKSVRDGIPDEIKKLPFAAFEFSVPETGAITFKITFEPGIPPATWPESRRRKARRQVTTDAADPAPAAEPMEEAMPASDAEPAEEAMPADIDAHFNVMGERRKALVEGVAGAIGERAIYQNAPSFAYVIGAYTVDKTGRLTGPATAPHERAADEGLHCGMRRICETPCRACGMGFSVTSMRQAAPDFVFSRRRHQHCILLASTYNLPRISCTPH